MLSLFGAAMTVFVLCFLLQDTGRSREAVARDLETSTSPAQALGVMGMALSFDGERFTLLFAIRLVA